MTKKPLNELPPKISLIKVTYFSDILCVWAYINQIRIRALLKEFSDQVDMRYRFMPLFASCSDKISLGWDHRGGTKAYGQHVCKIGEKYDHLKIHPDIWVKNIPKSSASVHNFIKAVQLLERKGHISAERKEAFKFRTTVEETIWRLRLVFFQDLVDVSRRSHQLEIAEDLGLPIDLIMESIQSGESLAELFRDFRIQDDYKVHGSPTTVLNEGRQIIFGNVGYRVLEANINELLTHPGSQASWC